MLESGVMQLTLRQCSAFFLSLFVVFPLAAQADTFDFNYQQIDGYGNGTSTTGTLITTDSPGGGIQTITSIDGTYNLYFAGAVLASEQITGLPQPDNAYGADDYLYLGGGPYLDNNGLTFTVNGPGDDGAGDVNIYFYDGAYYEPTEINEVSGTFTLTSAVPEPASAALAGCSGLLLFGFSRYRRRVRA